MPERPAPLVMVATPPGDQPFGSHVAAAADGRRLLAAELTGRLGRLGAAVAPLPAAGAPDRDPFHWGRWFAGAARSTLDAAGGELDAIGFAGGGALALLADDDLDALLAPIAGEVVANNRFSADAFVVAGDLGRALDTLERCESDNAAPRRLDEAGFAWRDLGDTAWARFDVDTTGDLALLRLGTRLENVRPIDQSVLGFLEMTRLPGDRPLEIPHLGELGEVVRSRTAELVVAGRVPGSTWRELESQTACRVRGIIEERGMRSARDPDAPPRSILASLMARTSPADLVAELARLGDAVVLDTRVLMAAVAGMSDTDGWPPAEERFASDFGDASLVATPWLRELVEAAAAAPVPFVLGAHGLIGDGLRLIVAAAWQGR
ncbi:MAG TPA: hypothetical protein VI277_02335 [Candidatus Limnocylindria bacterium]